MKLRRDIVPPVLLVAVLVLGWYFVAKVSGLGSFVLPSPVEVAQAGWETRGLLLDAIGTTLLATVIGLALALAAGVGLAALMDRGQPSILKKGMLGRGIYLVRISQGSHRMNTKTVIFE